MNVSLTTILRQRDNQLSHYFEDHAMLRNTLFRVLISVVLLTSCGGGGGATSTAASTAASKAASTANSSSSTATTLGMSHNAGKDCLSCHKAGGSGAAKAIFTLAGTVYKSSEAAQTQATVKLFIRNTNTLSISLTTDSLGNFYTTKAVTGLFVAGGGPVSGVDVKIEGPGGQLTNMPGLVTNGSCNACHGISNGKITAN